jgi:hypothetical protein
LPVTGFLLEAKEIASIVQEGIKFVNAIKGAISSDYKEPDKLSSIPNQLRTQIYDKANSAFKQEDIKYDEAIASIDQSKKNMSNANNKGTPINFDQLVKEANSGAALSNDLVAENAIAPMKSPTPLKGGEALNEEIEKLYWSKWVLANMKYTDQYEYQGKIYKTDIEIRDATGEWATNNNKRKWPFTFHEVPAFIRNRITLLAKLKTGNDNEILDWATAFKGINLY